jgi:hypothetical protein
MRRQLTSLCLTSLIAFTLPLATGQPFSTPLVQAAPTQPDSSPTSDLYYTFYGKKIPLALKPDTIAVNFKSSGGTRDLNARPLHLQLQEALQGNSSTRSLSRSAPPLQAEVKPLGNDYAIIQLPGGSREGSRTLNAVVDRVKQQSLRGNDAPSSGSLRKRRGQGRSTARRNDRPAQRNSH